MAADAPRDSRGSTMEAKNGLEKGPVVDCVRVVDPESGPTPPTSEVEKGLEKGPVVDRVGAVEQKRKAASEPQTYEEALAGAAAELWRKTIASLLENGTWELEELLDGFKVLPMKWVYKIKRDADGNIEHLVAKGYLQKQGIDFEEVYAPVSKHTMLRALLAVVAARNMELHQLDVKTAFLNGELEEEIYMQQPLAYE
jgi:hypothetical protein